MKEVTVYNLKGNKRSVVHTMKNVATMQKHTNAYAYAYDKDNNLIWAVLPGSCGDYVERINLKGVVKVEIFYFFPQMADPMVQLYTDSQKVLDAFISEEDEIAIIGNATKLHIQKYEEQKAEAENFEAYMEIKEEEGGEDILIVCDGEYCFTFGADAASFAQAAGLILKKSSVSGMRYVYFPVKEADKLLGLAEKHHCKAYICDKD